MSVQQRIGGEISAWFETLNEEQAFRQEAVRNWVHDARVVEAD